MSRLCCFSCSLADSFSVSLEDTSRAFPFTYEHVLVHEKSTLFFSRQRKRRELLDTWVEHQFTDCTNLEIETFNFGNGICVCDRDDLLSGASVLTT